MTKGRIRNNIRKLRFLGSEMTQQQLAEKIGVTRQTVIAIEQDKYSPSLEVAFRIARVFGVPLEEVFQYEAQRRQEAGSGGEGGDRLPFQYRYCAAASSACGSSCGDSARYGLAALRLLPPAAWAAAERNTRSAGRNRK